MTASNSEEEIESGTERFGGEMSERSATNLYYNQPEPVDEKSAAVDGLTPQLSINQHQMHPTQNQSFLPLSLCQPEPHHIPERHHLEDATTPLYSSDQYSYGNNPPRRRHIFSPNSHR